LKSLAKTRLRLNTGLHPTSAPIPVRDEMIRCFRPLGENGAGKSGDFWGACGNLTSADLTQNWFDGRRLPSIARWLPECYRAVGRVGLPKHWIRAGGATASVPTGEGGLMTTPATRRKFLGASLAVAGVLAAGYPARSEALEVGQKAPDFSLPSTTGEKISLSQFRGQPVLIEFYGADFAPA